MSETKPKYEDYSKFIEDLEKATALMSEAKNLIEDANFSYDLEFLKAKEGLMGARENTLKQMKKWEEQYKADLEEWNQEQNNEQ